MRKAFQRMREEREQQKVCHSTNSFDSQEEYAHRKAKEQRDASSSASSKEEKGTEKGTEEGEASEEELKSKIMEVSR